MQLKELIKHSSVSLVGDLHHRNLTITGIALDSRKVVEGNLFFAVEGENFDGHDFIDDAIKRGASAVIGRKRLSSLTVPYLICPEPRKEMAYISAGFYGNPAKDLTVIGVTGTDGKTTTVNLIYRMLLENNILAGMISTVNAVIGDEVLDTGFHVTTPESPQIQEYLKMMVDKGLTHVVLEATSHGLVQERVTACEFDVAVITNITHEHLDYHKNYAGYFDAKFRLVRELTASRDKETGNFYALVFNKDDRSYQEIEKRLNNPQFQKIKKFIYGLENPENDFSASNIYLSGDGIRFDLWHSGKTKSINAPIHGEYNVHNILAAITATSGVLGLDLDKTIDAVNMFTGVPGRMESISLGQDFHAIVDFAHTPNALKVALETARKITDNSVIAVFGSAGLRDKEKRKMMAAVSAELADITILTAEDPRTEDLDQILNEMQKAAISKGAVIGKTLFSIPDRGDAIRKAVHLAGENDIVLACGKGHEQSMCFGTIEYPWDDRTAMRAALAEILGLKEGPVMPYLPTQE